MRTHLLSIRTAAGLAALALSFAIPACGPSEQGDDASELAESESALTAAAWQPNRKYAIGDLVSYNGKVYRCIQAHTSQVGWTPEAVPALWSLEGLDQPGKPTPPSTPPASGVTFDYITLQADCDTKPEGCCAVGSTIRKLTEGADTFTSSAANECLLSLGERDTITRTASGASALLLGSGDDVAFDGPGDDLIWGGTGRDTINGYGGTNLFFGGWGDDILNAANGNNVVVPGPGADTVAMGTGDDTLHIFDVCEAGWGEKLDGGSGVDTLYTPVPLDQLRALGVQVVNFEKIVVKPQPCRSQCAPVSACDQCPDDAKKTEPGACGCNRADFNIDKDSKIDCLEECPLDPSKTEAGVCGCGIPDVDSNNNGVPDCKDPTPGTNGRPIGRCNDPAHPVPVGTLCSDGACSGTFSCRADGQCGDPGACSADCKHVNLFGEDYWFCPGPRTFDDAQAFCRKEPGRHLVRIDSAFEAALVAFNTTQVVWTGGSDRGADGSFSWSDHDKNAAAPFWTPATHRYAKWADGEPRTGSNDCVSIGADRRWKTTACNQSSAFVCEKEAFVRNMYTPRGTPPAVGGGDLTDNHDEAHCVDEAKEFQGFPTGDELENQVHACQFACQTEQCYNDCSIPTAFNASGGACDTDCKDPNSVQCQQSTACNGPFKPPAPGSTCETSFSIVRGLDYALPCTRDDECPWATLETFRDDRLNSFPVCAMPQGGTQKLCAMHEEYPANSINVRVPPSGAAWCTSVDTCPLSELSDGPALGIITKPVCMVVGSPDAGNVHRECRLVDSFPPGVGYDSHLGKAVSFGTPLCEEISLCGLALGPEETIHAANEHAGDLTEVPLPDNFLGAAQTKDPLPDFASALTPPTCATCTGKNHPFCHYDVVDGLDPRTPKVPTKNGGTGSGIKFDFSPTFSMTFGGSDGQPGKPFGPFGIPNASLKANASAVATVDIDLPIIDSAAIEVLNAHAGLNAGFSTEQCGVAADVTMKIFGVDFAPSVGGGSYNWPAVDAQNSCKSSLQTVRDTANRVQKAYHDALELVSQYKKQTANDRIDQVDTLLDNFGPGLCDQIFKGQGAPADFSADPTVNGCPLGGETAETTINRFIDYYNRTLGMTEDPAGIALHHPSLKQAVETLADVFSQKLNDGKPAWSNAEWTLFHQGDTTEQHTLFSQQFFIGPVPCNIEVNLSAQYGADVVAEVHYDPGVALHEILFPSCAVGDVSCSTQARDIIGATAHANPYAGVGLGLFAGVGFSVNGFTTKLGIEGALSLGRVGVNGHVGTGLSLASSNDGRHLPADLQALFPDSWAAGATQVPTRTLRPVLSFNAGLKVGVRDILSGSLSAKLKIKIAFFSKTWSKQLLKFNGICAGSLNDDMPSCDFPIFGTNGQVSTGGSDWGAITVPAPFAVIPRLPPAQPIPTNPGAAGPMIPSAPLDTTRIEKFFYDSLCTCAQTKPTEQVPDKQEEGCYRDADCCEQQNGAYCFIDPLRPDKATKPWGVCITAKRHCSQTCTKNEDCAQLVPTATNPNPIKFICRQGTNKNNLSSTFCMEQGLNTIPSQPLTWCPNIVP